VTIVMVLMDPHRPPYSALLHYRVRKLNVLTCVLIVLTAVLAVLTFFLATR